MVAVKETRVCKERESMSNEDNCQRPQCPLLHEQCLPLGGPVISPFRGRRRRIG